MNNIEKTKELRKLAEDLKLENCRILGKYDDEQLSAIYNGIGSDAMPDWMRNAVSALHPSLEVAALIHDTEWHETDFTKDSFDESNERFKRNGYTAAKAKFAWYNPFRYIVMNQARRFGNLCKTFGWSSWNTPCHCEVCQKQAMKNILLAFVVILVFFMLVACSHNVIQYSDGIGFDAGINPENFTASFNLRYGKILSAVTRDNVEIEMEGNAAGNSESSDACAATEGSLKVKIGRQINGYAVDLVKAGADAAQVTKALGK